jgi:hypothetical protein
MGTVERLGLDGHCQAGGVIAVGLKQRREPNLSLPFRTAQRPWSRRSAPPPDHRIRWDLFTRQLIRKLAALSVIKLTALSLIEIPTGGPARWRLA